ncbi:MAG: flagellar biosynthesis protein FlhA [Phycisphaerales bacterium]|nr:flagellar biosynthesis protein FlhA [Phycisphaerales bacterium]
MSDEAVNTSMGAAPAWMKMLVKHKSLLVPVGFVAMIGALLVPLPPMAMDVLICFNIALSVMILMTTLYMKEALEFSVFPSLLLGVTLLRLTLNVASTRLILTADAATPEQAVGVAGDVVSAFGHFVAGDSLIVGIIIFLILVLVQFIVITKGAGRISEVAARFTLDAMPGKQMAIDADLNAGTINEAEARRRREKVAQEADFYGAMDGASKFVKGDAIAGIIITAINVVGGITIGVLMRGWEVKQCVEVFTVLTIGDGLTSQIPAFIVSIASALVVTRSGSKDDLGTQLTGQVMSQPLGMFVTGGFLMALTLTPLPTVPLVLIGGALILTGLVMSGKNPFAKKPAPGAAQAMAAPARPEPPSPETLLKLDTMELEVGYGLVELVDANQGGDLLDRISAIRRQLAVELGFILPPVRIRDNLQLQQFEYRLKIKGNVVAKGVTIPRRALAINSGIATGPIEGDPTREPAFNLEAYWIDPAIKTRAETMNYTVVEPSAVLATHLTEVVRSSAADLLTRQEVTELLTQLKQRAGKLVEDTVPAIVKPGELHRILQSLLRERVPIRDLETILETLGDWAPKTKDPDVLVEYARNALRRTICHQYAVPDETGALRLVVATLDPALEDEINACIDRTSSGTAIKMSAAQATRITNQLVKGLRHVVSAGHQPVLLASPQVRAVARQLVESQMPGAAVLGYNEIVNGIEVESLALITQGLDNQGQEDEAAQQPFAPAAA